MNNDEKFDQIPDDFPFADVLPAVTGEQAKLSLIEYQGKFYVPGSAPPERFRRWQKCEELVQHLKARSLESIARKRAPMSETEILFQCYARLQKAGWTSEAESRWIIHRAALLLGWERPCISGYNSHKL